MEELGVECKLAVHREAGPPQGEFRRIEPGGAEQRIAVEGPRKGEMDGGARASSSELDFKRGTVPRRVLSVARKSGLPAGVTRRTPMSSARTYPLCGARRAWLRMAYCTTCLDGPEDRSGIVLEWGDSAGAPFVVSGQAWGEENLLRRPAILDLPVGRGHVVSFYFNPFHRDMNRGDHRLAWNAILNWQAILSASAPSPISTSSELDPSDP